jgi:diaminohydroxyphosphoribosylaminopyrimidine deaminase/5-amino-6-(5-phosphoribosylamino)uracil reductase
MAVVIGEREIPVDAKVRSHPGGFLHHPSHDISALLRKLFAQGIRSVYVEGGPTLASAFVAGDLVDEFHITVGPLLLGGGHTALTDVGVDSMSSARHLNLTSVTRVEDDVIVIARPTKEGH